MAPNVRTKFTLIKPVTEDDLKRNSNNTIISTSPIWQELTNLLDAWANGDAPSRYEIGGMVDFDDPQVKAAVPGSRNPKLAFMRRLRRKVDELKLSNKVELRQPKGTNKILIVGM